MNEIDALSKIETTKVEIDVDVREKGLYDEDHNLYAVKVCAGDFGFDDEFFEIEEALRRLERLENDMAKKDNDKRKILRDAIAKYSAWRQIDKAIEEMAELTKALLKDRHVGVSVVNHDTEVAEEIADVLIMVEQLIMIYDNEEAVNKTVNGKIARLKERLTTDGRTEQ